MPSREPVVAGGTRGYKLRHVGPKVTIWPNPPVTVPTFPILNQGAMISRPLPSADVVGTPAFQQGAWTGRLDDAGEGTVTFPNTFSADGTPWRDRFDSAGHNQFIEVYNDGYLESVFCIVAPVKSMPQIVVAGGDGFFLCKKSFERDWIVVQAPRDVIERGTNAWVPLVADDFSSPSVSGSVITTAHGTWTISLSGTVTSATAAQPMGVLLSANPSSPPSGVSATISSGAFVSSPSWRAIAILSQVKMGVGSLAGDDSVTVTVNEGNATSYFVSIVLDVNGRFAAQFEGVNISDNPSQTGVVPSSPSYVVMIESDGEWVRGFVNGQLIGEVRRLNFTASTAQLTVQAQGVPNACSCVVSGALLETLQPFLQRGADKGDYVLPGTASTYPNGGLHARYYNDLDLQSDAERLLKILAPTRSQAYAGSGTSEYANQQDPTISQQGNPTPGAATTNWSAKWFGAIYLKLSKGDYGLQMETPTGAAFFTAVRVWVGKTKWGDQLVDQWAWQNANANYSFTVSAAALAGTLPYGGGTVARDGWYPIVIEYAVDSGSGGHAPQLIFTNVPAAYTDPGGTAIASGAQTTIIPATSLSPLGCVDQRYQGVSHFDLVQQTAQAFGYQFSCEPQRLESGLFPGVLAPRIREGYDLDPILMPDTDPRKEKLLNYSLAEDASDFAASLWGNGAGFSSGTTGQLQSVVFDAGTLKSSLFDVQGWQDFADASFSPLLFALLNSNLGLRLTPWTVVSADPEARERQAFLWPLPNTLAQLRYRPGDGARLRARDISLWDTSPRQLLTIQRNFVPGGVTGTSVGWANRPRGHLQAQRQLFFGLTRLGRKKQGQLTTLTGSRALVTALAASTLDPNGSVLILAATDTLVRARLRVSTNSAPNPFNVWVNGVNATTALLGPWTKVPLNLDLGPAAATGSDGRFVVQIFNNAGVASTFDYQVFLDVLR